ncbi:MAG: hypothetical protein ACR2IK_20295, partial [Chloroflexota bacterium]
VFDVDPSSVESIADGLVPPAPAAYAWNQALMDLGATVCRAKRPLCLVCPLMTHCGGPRLSPGSPRPSTASEFRGSARYYRGRVVEYLAHLTDGQSVSVENLVAQLAGSSERDRLIALIERLAMEGLLIVDHERQVRLPE